jgi:predicted aspartyl protease
VEALVDTGKDDYLNLPPEVIRQLTRFGHARPASSETKFTARGAIIRKSHILRWVEFANVRFKDIQVGEAQRPAIGLALLENLNCVFDFPKQESWIEPCRTNEIICEPDASGLVVGFEPDHRALIRRIIPGYPADKMTIAIGDELLVINGRNAKELSYRRITRELSRTGKSARLVLKSRNTTYEVEFKLDRPYEYPPRWAPEDLLPKAKFLPDDK